MCYDIAYMTKRAEKYAEHYRVDKKSITANLKSAQPVYHVQAFAHPDIPVITNESPGELNFFHWGLIPFWVKDVQTATKISNQTLNARGEEMFNKPSFRNSARKRRCLVVVDGFYEHHWEDDKSYPFYISMKNDEPFSLGGLWETWRLEKEGIERHTVSIVTTRGNEMLNWIHNKPKASEGPRMPLIIPQELESDWLNAADDPVGISLIKDMIQPYESEKMKAHTVNRLRGKQYIGNKPAVCEPYNYEGFSPKY
ncbi:SOS response-associated peptidase [Fulvivirga sedimenti]|uniref:Abasic site processing protein n=1 Tax=Fulvivirga sedimenti TaxID=2879465 RepID=A0A9X1KZX3_9BACT|nr:SOS response-associated peptidase [Fulvivirga sedimenti]MCA6078785.1 SOS response-associated peptidase [Fulvivirga sedimenti]